MITGDGTTGPDRSEDQLLAENPTTNPRRDAEEVARVCEQVAAAMTLQAAPALAVDHDNPHLGAVPTLVITTNIGAYARDNHPGAQYIDLVLSAMLGAGFGLLRDTAPAALLGLPTPPGWWGRLDTTADVLTVSGPDGALYDGTIGPTPPTGWAAEVTRRQRLAVLLASTTELTDDNRAHHVSNACRAGKIVGALIPMQPTTLRR